MLHWSLLLYIMNTTTIAFLGLMAAIFIFGIVYVIAKPSSLTKEKRFVNSLPQILSTLGVIGTFWGITEGLVDFNVGDINASIPNLLEGLKTAFYTSLGGMITNLILRWLLDRKEDKADGGLSDMQSAQVEICKSIQAMSDAMIDAVKTQKDATEEMAQTVTTEIKKIAATQSSFSTQMLSAAGSIQQATNVLSELNGLAQRMQTLESNTNSVLLAADAQNQSLRSIQQSSVATSQNMIKVAEETAEGTHRLGEILDISSTNASTIDQIAEETAKLKDIIHGEVIEIEEAMKRTNNLLTTKFDEFSELLKKSNTEALVEVMKNVTMEFQRQMDALISKLIQENFEQLNKSVERLNQWQQENKEMIQSLTSQYRQMAENFEGTSTTLIQVSEDTEKLISRGGTLSQLINQLKAVMIDDTKFVQITSNLTDTVNLTKSNMQSFDETTTRLNEWVRKQRDFNEGVKILIAKLDELNKIRDYGEQFWSDTKRHMDEGIGIIKQGSKSLNEQLTSLDRQFYSRLSTTLAELDSCISAMIDHNKRR